MARFEVFIPASTPDDMNMTLRVTADTWMAALKVGLKKIGDASGLPQNVLCDIQDDESIHVTDPRNNRVFRIAQIPEISNPGVGVVLPAPHWMAAPSDPAPQNEEQLRLAARLALDRAAAEKEALERAEAERAAAEQAAAEKEAADRFARQKAEEERLAAEAEASERAAADQATAAEIAAERAIAEATAALAKAQADKATALSRAKDPARAAAKAAEEKAARDAEESAAREAEEKAAAEKQAAERDAAAKSAAQKAAAERAEKAKRAAEKAAAATIAAEKSARERLTAQRGAAAKSAAQKAVAEKATAEKVVADKAVSEALHAPVPVKIVEVDNQRSPPPAVIGRSASGTATEGSRVEEVLSELFERTPEMFQKKQAEALYFLLDLAMEKIPCESGTFYAADLNRRDLGFAAVRGPKASELLSLKLRVPMGKGFVGFCAQEGVAVAISDAQRDKRFFREISQRLGYETKSMITTPVIHANRTLGAIQLINKTGSTSFTPAELSILHYLAHQAALYLESQER